MSVFTLLVEPSAPALLAACIITLSLLSYTILRITAFRPLPGIPYKASSANSILGDVPSLLRHQHKNNTIFDWVANRCTELNEPVVQVFLQPFRKPWVAISDSREAYDILNRRSHEFDRAKFVTDLFAGTLPHHHVRMQTDALFKSRRKLVSVATGAIFINHAAAPLLEEIAHDLVQLWTRKAQVADGYPFEGGLDLKYAIFDGIWGLITGKSPGAVSAQQSSVELDDRSATLHQRCEHTGNKDEAVHFHTHEPNEAYQALDGLTKITLGAATTPLPALYFWYKSVFSSYRQFRQLQCRAVRAGIQTAMAQRNAPSEYASSVIECIVRKEQQMADEEGRVPDFESPVIRDEILGFLFAGDTSGSAIVWLVKYLSAHVDKQDKLRERLFSKYFKEDYDKGTTPTGRSILSTKTPYLDAVIEEVLRLTHPLPVMTRTAKVDTDVLGYHIPKGTDLFFMTSGSDLTQDTTAWQDSIPEHKRSSTSRENKDKHRPWDPANIAQFLPERWIKVDEEGNETYDSKAGPMLAFSGGPRGCPGMRLAYAELRILATIVLWHMELHGIPDECSSFEYMEIPMRQAKSCYVRPALLSKKWSSHRSDAKRDSFMA